MFRLKLGIIPRLLIKEKRRMRIRVLIAERGGVGITFNDKSLFFELGEIQRVLIMEKRIMGITINDKSLCLD